MFVYVEMAGDDLGLAWIYTVFLDTFGLTFCKIH